MVKKAAFHITLWLALFLPCLVQAGQPLRIITETFPPFNYVEDGTIKGVSVDLLVKTFELMGRSETTADIEVMPWARAYKTLRNDPNAMLFTMGRTSEREKLFKWAGPIYTLKIGVIALKERGIKAKTVKELNKYTIGIVRDGAPEQLLIKAGANIKALDRSGDSLSNIKKLDSGRIDVFVFPIPITAYVMKKQGLDASKFEVLFTLETVGMYYAFNKAVDDSFISEFQKSLDALKTNAAGTKSMASVIYDNYLSQLF